MLTDKKEDASRHMHLTTGEKNERQTKLSWATAITDYQEVPEPYKEFFLPLQLAGKPIPKTVVTPNYEGFMHKEPEKLVCVIEDKLYILKNSGPSGEICCMSFGDITCIEYKSVLLDSYLWVYGFSQNKSAIRELLHFNTISDFLFNPIMRQIREFYLPKDRALDLSFIKELTGKKSLKFSNLCKHSLLPGEKVLKMIWQPEKKVNFFKRINPIFYTPPFPNHVLLLTDYEIIIIHESEPQTRDDKYGSVSDFIPLGKIKSITLLGAGSDLLHLEINLIDGTKLQSLYQPDLAPQLEDLIAKFNLLCDR